MLMQAHDPIAAVMHRLAERLKPTPSPYKRKPVAWVRDKIGEHTTDDLRNVFMSVRDNRYTAVQSCHDVGKSWGAARLAAWWLDTHPVGEALVITTAPTAQQVSGILWREIGKTHRKGKLFGRVTGDNKWKVDWGREDAPEEVAIGRKPADYDPAAFQGYHARFVLVIIDEACGVPQALYNAVDALVTNRHARVLAIGNPDDPSSHFADICKPGSGWHTIRINGLHTPGFTAQRVKPYPRVVELMAKLRISPSTEYVPAELYDLLIDPLWVEERIRRWGVDSPLFQSKVLGLFPKVSIDTLIHPHWVVLAQAREMEPYATMSRIGCDVARYGVDHTIILLRQGGCARVVHDIPYGPVTETAGLIQKVGGDLGTVLPTAMVDDDGVGGGVVDILKEDDYPHVAIHNGGATFQKLSNGKPRFYNKRAELYWNLKELLAGVSGTGEDGWLDLDPADDELAAQLTNIKYKINRHGQIEVESKDSMKARGLPSPDRADALAYAVAPDELLLRHQVQESHMVTSGLLTERW
jgi:hypothetical protein